MLLGNAFGVSTSIVHECGQELLMEIRVWGQDGEITMSPEERVTITAFARRVEVCFYDGRADNSGWLFECPQCGKTLPARLTDGNRREKP